MVPRQIEREVFVEAPAERVWALLTEPEHLRAWYAFDGAEVDLRRGALVFRWAEHGEFHAVVEAVEPGSRFSFRLAVAPGRPPSAGGSTLVEFTLTAEPGGTRVRVVESGFRDLSLSDAERAEHAENQAAGWEGGFDTLGSHAFA
ncbi:SRPBCC domain-containing protein [Amycolatopsis lurida]